MIGRRAMLGDRLPKVMTLDAGEEALYVKLYLNSDGNRIALCVIKGFAHEARQESHDAIVSEENVIAVEPVSTNGSPDGVYLAASFRRAS
jgi:hypothetical protein